MTPNNPDQSPDEENPGGAQIPKTEPISPDAEGRPLMRRLMDHLLWIPFALIILVVICKYTVDIPSIDQWDRELPWLEKTSQGTATFADLLEQDLEYRPAVNRVIVSVVAPLTNWNVRVEIILTWLGGCACVAGVVMLAQRTLRSRSWTHVLLLMAAGSLILGLPQYVMWTNGVSLTILQTQAVLIFGLLVAGSGLSPRWRFGLCIFFSVVATYSAATGMLAWIVLLVALLLPATWRQIRQLRNLIAVWGVAALLSVGRYFWDYRSNSRTGIQVDAFFDDPLLLPKYFFTVVGSPFAGGTALDAVSLAMLAGFIIVLLYLGVGAYGIRYRNDFGLIRNLMPWLMLGGYTIVTAAGVALGRSRFGVAQALASQYVMIAGVYSIVPVLFLVSIVLDHGRRQFDASGNDTRLRHKFPKMLCGERYGIRIFTGLFAAMVVFHLLYSVQSIQSYRRHYVTWLRAKACMLFIKCFQEEPTFQLLWQRPAARLIAGAEFLSAKGYLKPPLIDSPVLRNTVRLANQDFRERGRFGAMEQAGRPNSNSFGVSGWAYSPRLSRPADAVVLTWEKAGGECTAFGIADAGLARPDLMQKFASETYELAGWVKTFDAGALPAGDLLIRGWAFDTVDGKAFELEGSFALKRD